MAAPLFGGGISGFAAGIPAPPAAIYRADAWYAPGAPASSASAVAANRHYAIPVPIDRAVTIKGVGIQCTTLSAGNARIGIYADSGAMAPGALVAYNNANISTGATGFLSGVFDTNPRLSRGIYWFTTVFSGTPVVHAARGDNPGIYSQMVRLYGSDTGANAATGWFALYAALTFGVPPATFGAATFNAGTNSPVVFWQAVP